MQFNNLPEFDVERAMGIENVELGMERCREPVTTVCGLGGFPFVINRLDDQEQAARLANAGADLGSGWLELDAAVTRA